MNSLVIGYGSIGRRHAKILSNLGHSVSLVSKHSKPDNFKCYKHVEKALDYESFDYIIIANSTSDHLPVLDLLQRVKYPGRILVEKPIFSTEIPTSKNHKLKNQIFVGYNFRHHSLVQKLSFALRKFQVISAQLYVGQYLPQWRPTIDYRNSYSAKKNLGGGVLRDLSHELDLALLFFGDWDQVAALKGQFSQLAIDSEDTVGILMKCKRCPVLQIQMNYLDRVGRRTMVINCDECTIFVDLIKGRLAIDKNSEVFEEDRNATYKKMHVELTESKSPSVSCSYDEGIKVLGLISAVEKAAQMNRVQQRTDVAEQ